MALEQGELSQTIIGAAIAVHKNLGPGFIEAIYENALTIELQVRGISFKQQLPVPILYRGVEVGVHRLDLVVDDRMVVELKAVKQFDTVHFAVVRSYLTAVGLDHGLLINFAKLTLEIKRVGRLTREPTPGFLGS
jgi:GxxExxY protein